MLYYDDKRKLINVSKCVSNFITIQDTQTHTHTARGKWPSTLSPSPWEVIMCTSVHEKICDTNSQTLVSSTFARIVPKSCDWLPPIHQSVPRSWVLSENSVQYTLGNPHLIECWLSNDVLTCFLIFVAFHELIFAVHGVLCLPTQSV